MKKFLAGFLMFIVHAAIGTVGVGFVTFLSVFLVVSRVAPLCSEY